MDKRKLIALAAISLIVLGAVLWPQFAPKPVAVPMALPEGFIVPTFTAEQQLGQNNFTKYCAACHGDYGLGTDSGPTFMHRVYEPNHHGDGAFYNAALNGIRAHHWKFGDMPPVEGISEAEIGPIVAYIRALQKANGVF